MTRPAPAETGTDIAVDARPRRTAGPLLLQYTALAYRPVLFFVILLTIWEISVRVSGISPALLPSPIEIVEATWRDRDNIWRHTWVTIQTVAIGVAGALVFAVLIAVLLDTWDWVRRSIYPVLVVSQTLPIVAIAPLVVIWFGFGITSHARVVAMYTFFPMAIGLSQGLASTDVDAMRLLRTMGAGKLRLLLKVRFPSALPQFFTGVRVAMSFAVTAAVIAQFVGAVDGLGIYMLTSKNALRTDLVFGAVAVTSALTLLVFAAIVIIQRAVMPWYRPNSQGDNDA